ncbi:hypothetical protein AVEN_113946-1 [Araneus ventricosus]|uniref:Uncharacterized protein n=1 Tax=Araneus ventricosus TaxID=182803 RepID=A0A4Y2IXW6_ARAVE|nr:hypothetical protein AVEN_113946-1 [Araneus ventricosus]
MEEQYLLTIVINTQISIYFKRAGTHDGSWVESSLEPEMLWSGREILPRDTAALPYDRIGNNRFMQQEPLLDRWIMRRYDALNLLQGNIKHQNGYRAAEDKSGMSLVS